jgi:hypothetical protein
MSKTKKNRLPIGSPELAPAKAYNGIPPTIEEPQTPRPITPPLNVGELLANVKPDVMEELNAMSVAINTSNGDVLNWATNERMKLDVLIAKIEAEQAEEEAKMSQKQISQKRSYWRDWWRWLRGIKE